MVATQRAARQAHTCTYRVQVMDRRGFRVAVCRPSPYRPWVPDGYQRIETA